MDIYEYIFNACIIYGQSGKMSGQCRTCIMSGDAGRITYYSGIMCRHVSKMSLYTGKILDMHVSQDKQM